MSEFRVQENGFQIEMANGYTVSVQFGKYHYCSSRHGEKRDSWRGLQCSDAEVAVMDSNDKFIALDEHDDVRGYQSVSEVIALINKFNDM